MTFDKLKATTHTEAEVKADLNPEEDTSTDTGQADENDTGSEEDTSTNEEVDDGAQAQTTTEEPEEDSKEYWKQKAEKLEEVAGNYQQGMIAAKAKKRADDGISGGTTDAPADEQAVIKVLEKQNERKALKEVINPKSGLYLPELVDDNQYLEIVGYLPNNIDKSSPENIHRALKLAVKYWKEDKGIVDKTPTNKKAADLTVTRSGTASGVAPANQTSKGERKLIKKHSGTESWY